MLVTLLLSVAIISVSPAFSDSDDIYESKNSDYYVPCENGWYYFRNKCYRVAGRSLPERFSWNRALELCRRYGADLVSIQSQEEQNFVTAYLQLDVKWWAWIGLNDRDKEGDYTWSDGSVFNYTNWHINEPSLHGGGGEEEDCTHIIFEPKDDAIGKWNDRSCDATEYALCERKENHRRRSPNLMYCSNEDGGGWKYGTSCYHIVTEMKTWANAEKYCQNTYEGNLLTIQDTLEDTFIELALPDIKNDIWIGIKIEDQWQQKWTSGWFVSYDRFHKDERFEEGTCVARKNRKEWIPIPCSTSLPFICEVTTDTAPEFDPPKENSHCPKQLDDWRDFGGDYCYYVETGRSVNFYEANFECQSRGGDLASIYSEEESNILHSFVKYKGYSVYIGLIRLKENNEETFGWTDGADMDFLNWAHGEPNRLDEKCVEALTQDMKWRDISCDQKLSGFICAVEKIVSNSNIQESPNCENFCIAPDSYLHGIVSQYPNEAKKVTCNSE